MLTFFRQVAVIVTRKKQKVEKMKENKNFKKKISKLAAIQYFRNYKSTMLVEVECSNEEKKIVP